MKNCFFFMLFILIVSCTGKKDRKLSSAEGQVKFEQYLVEGQALYTTYCANCHRPDGRGLAKLYPPLAGSDYLMSDMARGVCIINKGLKGAIKVNGVVYKQPMPAIPALTKLEIAEIMTYITNSWGNEHGMISIEDVTKALKNCEP